MFLWKCAGARFHKAFSFLETGGLQTLILEKTGEQGGEWIHFNKEIIVSNDWSIILEHSTIITALWMGDVAIDDVTVTLQQGKMS